MPIKAYYSATVASFLEDDPDRILGILASEHHHSLEEQQKRAWLYQLSILKANLTGQPHGRIFIEFYIPRMGKRADAILISRNIVFVIEFKVGASTHTSAAFDQVEDYALDLKNFHEASHSVPIVPLIVSTEAESNPKARPEFASDLVSPPLAANKNDLGYLIDEICRTHIFPQLDIDGWMAGGYRPTPTIIEAAEALYRTHGVEDISRSDAGAKNLRETARCVAAVIDEARHNRSKAICFITGVPGSGKTLAGLNIATRRSDEHADEHAVFLSGNGPLVDVLREALARDKASREGISKNTAQREVRSFIQNIHHFRDNYVGNHEIPVEKVVVFDEAQRAWTRQQATDFMRRKRAHLDFNMSEPEFLISVMDRHKDWCTIVCLVGEGQEINTGEAGISEWINTLRTHFKKWQVHISSRMTLSGPNADTRMDEFMNLPQVYTDQGLHLAVSIRSFRAETLSEFVGHVVDNDPKAAQTAYKRIEGSYPLYLSRDLVASKSWLKGKARGTERFGLVASSGALRLRPEGIHIKAEIEPQNWFLNSSADVRSSCYLEDVASEFAVQGLELDWVGVCWDGDFNHNGECWAYQAFKGTKWQSVKNEANRSYLKNTYRVILTRARQGMVIFIPKGDLTDRTRPPSFYDGTFDYLRTCGIPVLN